MVRHGHSSLCLITGCWAHVWMMIHNQMLLSTGTNNGCEPLRLLRIVNLQNEPSIMPHLPPIVSWRLLVGNCTFWDAPTYVLMYCVMPFFQVVGSLGSERGCKGWGTALRPLRFLCWRYDWNSQAKIIVGVIDAPSWAASSGYPIQLGHRTLTWSPGWIRWLQVSAGFTNHHEPALTS